MTTLVLEANSRLGKNRINQWGDEWIIVHEDNDRIMIISVNDDTEDRKSLRNIKHTDPDFCIVGEIFA